MSGELRAAIAALPIHRPFTMHDYDNDCDVRGTRFVTGPELADAILALPVMAAHLRVVEAALEYVHGMDEQMREWCVMFAHSDRDEPGWINGRGDLITAVADLDALEAGS